MNKHKTGFTIFFAVLVASLALAIGLAIYDLTVRELSLSGTATQSQIAIDDADTGIDCALYWDSKYNGGGSVFPTSTSSVPPSGSVSNINCNSQDISTRWTFAPVPPTANTICPSNAAGSCEVTSFWINFTAPRCVNDQVVKYSDVLGVPHTSIYSYGFSSCVTGATNQLERTLQVFY